MKLSAPIYSLKRKARLLARQKKIPLHTALDHVAGEEGFSAWSLLATRMSAIRPAGKLFAQLRPGDLVLVGARPGHGKTLLSLELAVEAMKAGHRSVFFSLDYAERHVSSSFQAIGADRTQFGSLFEFDSSDAISAGYIMEKLGSAPRGTLAVVDYLQLLDQKRDKPELMIQIPALKAFARDRGLIIVFISQIDRAYDPARKPCPDLADVRLPNPLDLSLFNKTCFLNNGEVQFRAAG
ncbi:DNA helicase [Taklimakanibacter lacteus]|uniref:DNA helicase n=1 Tax=Taklimakanibacter lacteus TaxID=2268456 RepID=UPI000E66480B